ncbi:rhodanese-like domain-containing protein [Amycolatopsis sp. K13G38]|uniref:Rhodanese-like domain-containing protein n=1 Tax=Amycolatopsis acididurans TaxID=2724524 RepID=A0ABX1JLF0_9PSEU|nr:rhodanese-like domain-containing protein [Amycolatopsis acididurans]NKQ59350.1 rhodanese-like domain-containing protein [Amycolatopsis acididurans]
MIQEADVRELAAAHRGGALVVDVREPGEYSAGHVPGARLVPLASLPGRIAELPRGERIYVICASGGRSRAAAGWLASAGLDARSVSGGTSAWIAAGGPVVRGPRENAA